MSSTLMFWFVLILLPPSEGKTPPRRGKPLDLGDLSSPALTATRTRVLDALVSLCDEQPERAASVLEVPKSQLELVALNASLRSAPTARADAVYAGVLYDALGMATLSAGARRRATSRVRVTSSLFGLVAPTDRIPAYRLSGDAVLPGVGTVSGVWRQSLGPEITELVGDGLLVDLRSGMYAAFWRPAALPRVATVRVLHEVAGRAPGGQPLQQGDQGPDPPRAARGRREPAHPGAPGRGLARSRLGGRGGGRRRGAVQLDVVVCEL